MPRVQQTIMALNNGEVSRRFEARQDQNKYMASVAKAENWIPLPLGGMRRAEGSVFVAQTKHSGSLDFVFADVDQVVAGADLVIAGGGNKKVRLIKFKFNAEQAYVLEFGDFYIRFYKDGAQIMAGGSPLEIVTPYPESMLDHVKLSAFQSADVMYIPSDGTLPVYKLRRTNNNPDTFDIAVVNFRAPGTIEAELTGEELGGMTLTPAATSGDGITFTASSAVFLAGDVGLAINGPNGARAVISTFTNSTHVDADIIDPFVDTSAISPEDWSLEGTPAANIDPSKVAKGGAMTISADADAFRSAYVGKYVLVYGGLVEVTQVSDARNLRGIVRSDLIDRDQFNPSPTAFWLLHESAWTDEEGYPTAGCFYQERMWLLRGQTRWGSNSGDFENFAIGSDDSAGISRTISDDEINDGRWLKGSINGLFTATAGGQYQATASQERGALTPNDFNEAPISTLGTEEIAPIRAEGLLLYVLDGGRQLIEQAFDFVENKFNSPNMLLLADHLTEFNSITALDYQSRPISTMWAVRDDGVLLACTYKRAEQVVGWAPRTTQGEFTDVCVIPRPSTSRDWPWVLVERQIGTQICQCVEYFEDFNGTLCREWREAMTDSAVFTEPQLIDEFVLAGEDYVLADDDFVIAGISETMGIRDLHLEGREVRMIGDGFLFNDQIVRAGQVPIVPAVPDIGVFEIGLDYVSRGETLEPVIADELGGILAARGWADAGARIRRTMGLKLNGQQIPYRQATDAMDQQVPLKRGKVLITVQEHGGPAPITFTQDVPFPAEILNISGRVVIADEPGGFLIAEETPTFLADCEETDVAINGFMSNACDFQCPFGQYSEAAMTFVDATSNSGVAIRSIPSATRKHYTGLAAIYYRDAQQISLQLFDDDPLSAPGAVQATLSMELHEGDRLMIHSNVADAEEYFVNVNGLDVIGPITILASDLNTNNSCVGTVRIAD